MPGPRGLHALPSQLTTGPTFLGIGVRTAVPLTFFDQGSTFLMLPCRTKVRAPALSHVEDCWQNYSTLGSIRLSRFGASHQMSPLGSPTIDASIRSNWVKACLGIPFWRALA